MKWRVVVPIVAAGVVLSSAAAAQFTRGGYDEPEHAVLVKDGRFEVRAYGPRLVALTKVEVEEWSAATSRGFSRLADFIFGGNRDQGGESAKIAMTTPVETIPDGDSVAVVFTMPAEYTQSTLPHPQDGRVRIEELPAATVASYRFSGVARRADLTQLKSTLLAAVSAQGYEPTSEVRVAQYDPPWIPGWLRRNEVMVDVRPRLQTPKSTT